MKLARKSKQIIDTAYLVYTFFGHVTIDIISMKTFNKESRNSNKKLFKINLKILALSDNCKFDINHNMTFKVTCCTTCIIYFPFETGLILARHHCFDLLKMFLICNAQMKFMI
jgi:hypothetical protein